MLHALKKLQSRLWAKLLHCEEQEGSFLPSCKKAARWKTHTEIILLHYIMRSKLCRFKLQRGHSGIFNLMSCPFCWLENVGHTFELLGSAADSVYGQNRLFLFLQCLLALK